MTRAGALALRVTLALALYYAVSEPMHACGERVHHLSVLGVLFPRLCALPHAVFASLQLAFIGAAAAWALKKLVPWSAWAATFLFVALESARQETSYLSDHEAYTVTMVLILQAAWLHFRGPSAPMPRWAGALAIGYLGWTYTLAGIAKLWASGLAWADGSSLRLWLVHSGGDASAVGAAVVASPVLSRALQSVTLAVETLALPLVLPFALAFARGRDSSRASRGTVIALGVTLIAMHVSTTMLFGVRFYGNVALCALFLVWLPVASTEAERDRPVPSVP